MENIDMCKKEIKNNNKLNKPHEMHHENNAINIMIKMDRKMQCQHHIQKLYRDHLMNNDHSIIVNTYTNQSGMMSNATTKVDQIRGDDITMKTIWMETETAVDVTNAVLSEYPKTRKMRNAMRCDVP